MIDSATLQKLNEQPWEELFLQLLDYTNNLLKRYKVRAPHTILPKGFDAQMVVDDAIEAVYTGRRVWDYQAKPNFLLFMTTQVIRSMVYNLYASQESQLVQELVVADLDGEEIESNPIESLIPDKAYILENMYEKEFMDQVDRVIQQNDTTQDQLLMKVYQGRLQGFQNKQIAQQLDIPISTIENIIKKLRRILKPLTR
ncbi:MAG: hypothetical protein KKG00_11275 [Bacteroidetes bacterium]|nr:hypothetical protein [Bacteroidota bacterium]